MNSKNILVQALNTYCQTFLDQSNGHASEADLIQAADILYKTIDNLIATRIWQNNEIKSKERSQKRLEAAEKLNSSVQATCAEVKSLIALSTCPPPDQREAYEEWYATTRSDALKIS